MSLGKGKGFPLAELFITFIVVLVFSIIIFAFVSSFWQAQQQLTLSSSGVIAQGDFFTLGETSLDWGELYPDSQAQKNITIASQSKANVDYYVTTTNWSPKEAEQYFDLGWEKQGSIIMLTLHVSPDTEGITEFSFDIVVTGTA